MNITGELFVPLTVIVLQWLLFMALRTRVMIDTGESISVDSCIITVIFLSSPNVGDHNDKQTVAFFMERCGFLKVREVCDKLLSPRLSYFGEHMLFPGADLFDILIFPT